MKQLTVIGASAGVGLLTVRQALEKGHKVVTLSRSVDSLPDLPNLTKMQGSATSVEDVKKAITSSDAIIVTIGTGASTKTTTLYTDAASALLEALTELDTQPTLVVLTGFGAGDSGPYNSLLMRLLFHFVLKTVYANKTAMEELITRHYPNRVMVRSGRLSDRPFTGTYRVYTALTPDMKVGSVSRANVSHYLLTQAETPTDLRKYPALSDN